MEVVLIRCERLHGYHSDAERQQTKCHAHNRGPSRLIIECWLAMPLAATRQASSLPGTTLTETMWH
jgi:hypothetical protein